MKTHNHIKQVPEDFPWIAFSWVLKEYGYYLTIPQLSHVLGINRKDCVDFIASSKVPAKLMPGGKTVKYAFIDIPKIIEQGEKAQMEKFSKIHT